MFSRFLFVYILQLCVKYYIYQAPKIVHTIAHLDLYPPSFLDNPEKLIRNKILTESQGSNNHVLIANSFLESFLTIENIHFDLPFQLILLKTKSENFAGETIKYESILRPYISDNHSVH